MTSRFRFSTFQIPRPNPLKLFGATMVVAFATSAWAQTTPPRVTLENSAQHSITSKATRRTYEIMVSLPGDYETSGKKYPVLYALDGWHFPLLAFIQRNSIYTKRMPPVIVVVIGHGHPPDLNAVREQDFLGPISQPKDAGKEKADSLGGKQGSPTSQSKGISGHAERFLTFLEGELIPFIDGQYRTVPTDRALLGHSYGGGFAIYALAERPTLFQRIVCVSPSFASTRATVFNSLLERLERLPAPVVLDLSVGTEGDLTEETVALALLMDSMKQIANLRRRLTIYNGENHDSVRLNAFPAGLYWVYR